MKDQNKACLCALSAVFFWSTVASAFKLALREVDYLVLLFFSSLTSMVFLFIVLVFSGKLSSLKRRVFRARKSLWNPGDGSDFENIEREKAGKPLLMSALGGLLNPFLYYIVLFKAYSLLPAQEAQPLNYTWPVVIAIMAVPILGEKMRAATMAALLVSFSGVIIISTRGHISGMHMANPLGSALALGSSLIWSSFWLMNVKDRRDPAEKLFLNFFFGFIFIAVLLVVLRLLHINGRYDNGAVEISSGRWAFLYPGWKGLAAGIYVGLFEMGLTFILWLKALNLTKATAAVSSLVFLSPFISLIFIKLIVGEDILPSSFIGLILIIAGVLIQVRMTSAVAAE